MDVSGNFPFDGMLFESGKEAGNLPVGSGFLGGMLFEFGNLPVEMIFESGKCPLESGNFPLAGNLAVGLECLGGMLVESVNLPAAGGSEYLLTVESGRSVLIQAVGTECALLGEVVGWKAEEVAPGEDFSRVPKEEEVEGCKSPVLFRMGSLWSLDG